MPVLLIQNAAGETEIRELSKHISVAIGRHSSNDIRVDDPAVQVLHARISWNSRGYEVVAATGSGVDVNGKHVPSAMLTLGDCIQVGQVGLFYYDRQQQAEAALRGEEVVPEPVVAAEKTVGEEPARTSRRSADKEPDSGDRLHRGGQLPPRRASEYFEAKESEAALSEAELDYAPLPEPRKTPPPVNIFAAGPVRPGEQDVMRSPLVMSLGIGTIVLIMMALALWLVIGRDASQKAFQLAEAELEQQRFTQAITMFEEFLKAYPNHRLATAAKYSLGVAKAEQPIAGAVPAWERSLQSLDEFLVQHRREKEFPDILPKVLDLAQRIAKGSAETAGTQKQPELLKTSRAATQLFQQYSPQEPSPKQTLDEIELAVRKAEGLIRKHGTFQTALKEIDKGLTANEPFAAFDSRRKLLLKYPDLTTDKELQARLAQALEAERKLTVRQVLDQAAQTSEAVPPVILPSLNLIRHTRTRVDTVPGETTVFTVAHETCFAADSMTGALRWRRVIGLDTPFPPQPVSLDVMGLLLFDTRVNELILVKQRDGSLIWRQPLSEPAASAPLVHAGQIFIPTRSGKLCQLDAATGTLTAQLTFSQPPGTSPILVANDERLIMAGDRAVLYTLNYRPLECVAVTYTGHSPGSLTAPLLQMGDFLLTTENDRQNSALLRVWDVSPDQPLKQLAADRIDGQARDAATLRGKQLIVPSSPERLAAFTVSDEKGEQALAKSGTYQAEHPQGGPIYVTLGPDGEMWMTSSTLRRLQIGPDSIVPLKGELSLGVASQPVQLQDQIVFATSRLKYTSATYFLAADRQEMTSQWLSVFGTRALMAGTVAAADGSIPLLTDSGDVYSVMVSKLKAGGIDSRPVTTLQLPAGLNSPIGATVLANGRVAAWCGGTEPRLWQMNGDGILTRESKLPEALEAAPVPLSGGILLPLPGKLRLIESTEFSRPPEDLMLKVDPQQPTRWKGIVALDNKQAIAVTDQGRVIRGQVRAEPVPHVAEVTALELKANVDQPVVLIGNRLFVVTGKALHGLDVGTLEKRGEVELPDVVSQGPWVVGEGLLMVCGRDHLIAVTADPVAIKWKQKLTQGAFAGAPLQQGDNLLVASQSGELTIRSAATGDVVRSVSVRQPLVLGPLKCQDQTFAATLDGSLLLLNPWLEAQP